MTLLCPPLNEIYAPIEKDLEEFSKSLKKELVSDDELINDIHQHLLKMVGKFLRPALTILCSRLENKNAPSAIQLAVAVELIHTATLIHDDIIDNSELRRNQPSIYSKWGREISIVSGDYLYAKAFRALAGLKDVWVNETFSACAQATCEGEMKQIEKRNNFLMSEAECIRIIQQKTAALFRTACACGAHLSGTSPANVEKAGSYGFHLGMAFQIVDDCLDLTGKPENLGKTTGLDIHRSDVTLPLLYLFQSLGETQRRDLFKDIENDGNTTLNEIKKLALESKSIDRAMTKAREYSEKASSDLTVFKDSAYKDSLAHLSGYCLERVR